MRDAGALDRLADAVDVRSGDVRTAGLLSLARVRKVRDDKRVLIRDVRGDSAGRAQASQRAALMRTLTGDCCPPASTGPQASTAQAVCQALKVPCAESVVHFIDLRWAGPEKIKDATGG